VLGFYEFFAGGGMARAGLGSEWTCLFANEIDEKKAVTYAGHWGAANLLIRDVARVKASQLPGIADLAWASFPCQDLSLAGSGAGLQGERSGTFWPFWKLMKRLIAENRAPKTIVLENVCGALTSHEGKDFNAIADAFAKAKYAFGALVIDAALFVPQSRPRLFVVATRLLENIPAALLASGPTSFHSPALVTAYDRLPAPTKQWWKWWGLPRPAYRNTVFADIIEEEPTTIRWHSHEQTQAILNLMSDLNRKKVRNAQRLGKPVVGGVYKRTRPNDQGEMVQRAEVRFDDISGCLRTPAGGSSRQTILIVDGNRTRSRLLSPREAARLMGLPDDYELPTNYNEAYHLAGDGVVVPVVRFLAANLLEPLVCEKEQTEKAA
jgi:DNA (cytosine-5)-methyltransferase 1